MPHFRYALYTVAGALCTSALEIALWNKITLMDESRIKYTNPISNVFEYWYLSLTSSEDELVSILAGRDLPRLMQRIDDPIKFYNKWEGPCSFLINIVWMSKNLGGYNFEHKLVSTPGI